MAMVWQKGRPGDSSETVVIVIDLWKRYHPNQIFIPQILNKCQHVYRSLHYYCVCLYGTILYCVKLTGECKKGIKKTTCTNPHSALQTTRSVSTRVHESTLCTTNDTLSVDTRARIHTLHYKRYAQCRHACTNPHSAVQTTRSVSTRVRRVIACVNCERVCRCVWCLCARASMYVCCVIGGHTSIKNDGTHGLFFA